MHTDYGQLFANLSLGTLMGAWTVLVHFFGLMLLTHVMNLGRHRLRPHENHLRRAFAILVVVLGIFLLHTLEIWSYAMVYVMLDEVETFERALYFSTGTFTTVGFGDVVLSPRWRMFSAIEGANGWILFAWSTAFLMTVTTRLKVLEHDWLESSD